MQDGLVRAIFHHGFFVNLHGMNQSMHARAQDKGADPPLHGASFELSVRDMTVLLLPGE